MQFADLTHEQLFQLRKEITLNSLFLADYENSLDMPRSLVCDFFDGFMDFLSELEREDNDGKELPIEEFFDKYDTEENLIDWYYCHDEFGDEEDWKKWSSLSDEEKEDYDGFADYYEQNHNKH